MFVICQQTSSKTSATVTWVCDRGTYEQLKIPAGMQNPRLRQSCFLLLLGKQKERENVLGTGPKEGKPRKGLGASCGLGKHSLAICWEVPTGLVWSRPEAESPDC